MDAGIRLERNRLRRKAITRATVNALDVNVLSCEAIAALVIQRLHGELAKRKAKKYGQSFTSTSQANRRHAGIG